MPVFMSADPMPADPMPETTPAAAAAAGADVIATDPALSKWSRIQARPCLEINNAPGCVWCRQKRGLKFPSHIILCKACVRVINRTDGEKINARCAPLPGEVPCREWARAEGKRKRSRELNGDAYARHRERCLERYYTKTQTHYVADVLPEYIARGIL